MQTSFLKKLPLFAHLANTELEIISAFLERHVYAKNELIFQEGNTAKRLYMVFDGEVKISKLSPNGKEHILRIMRKYDLIAEVPMFAGETYPANCTALTDTVLLSISRSSLMELIKRDPEIALNMLALQSKRLREFTLKIEKLTLNKTEQRLADFFISRHPVPHSRHPVLDTGSRNSKPTIDSTSKLLNDAEQIQPNNLNIQDLANYLGVSRENISRIISKWIKQKIISKQQGDIIILDAHALRDIANNTVNPPGFSGHAAE